MGEGHTHTHTHTHTHKHTYMYTLFSFWFLRVICRQEEVYYLYQVAHFKSSRKPNQYLPFQTKQSLSWLTRNAKSAVGGTGLSIILLGLLSLNCIGLPLWVSRWLLHVQKSWATLTKKKEGGNGVSLLWPFHWEKQKPSKKTLAHLISCLPEPGLSCFQLVFPCRQPMDSGVGNGFWLVNSII